jgi:hypothetical protein
MPTYRLTAHTAKETLVHVVHYEWQSIAPHYKTAKEFVANHMPGYELCSTGRQEPGNVYRFEAVNYNKQVGATLWVREI